MVYQSIDFAASQLEISRSQEENKAMKKGKSVKVRDDDANAKTSDMATVAKSDGHTTVLFRPDVHRV